MTQEDLDAARTRLIPTWTSLRTIGNSKVVQASAVFPIIGYVILLSSQFTSFFDGGLAGGESSTRNWWAGLWAAKLYFVYFGLLNLGLGSAIYQWRCPRQIKKHQDWEDYVRFDGEAMSEGSIRSIGTILNRSYFDDLHNHGGANTSARDSLMKAYLREYYSVLAAGEHYSRAVVTCLFVTGLVLLSIPSSMTAIKILSQIIKS